MDTLIDFTEPDCSSTDNLLGRRDVALNILKPSVRLLLDMFITDHELEEALKPADDALRQLVDSQDFRQLSRSKIFNAIPQLLKVFQFDFSSFRFYVHSREREVSQMGRSPEHLVRFFDSAVHILQCVYSNEYMEKEYPASWVSLKKDVSNALDELEFLRNLLRMLRVGLERNDKFVKRESFFSAQEIPAALSFLVCSFFGPLFDDKNQVTKHSRNFKTSLPLVRERIHSHVRQLFGDEYDRSRELPELRGYMDIPAKIIDEEVVDFFGRLIDKLRKQHISSGHQTEIAIQEQNFLRVNLLDILRAYSQENSAVKEMESLSLSTFALIIETAYRTYFPRPYSANQIRFLPENDATFSSSNLTNLIDSVNSLKQRASDLFKSKRVFSVSTCNPSCGTNPVEYVTCLVQNLEELIKHKAASIAPLSLQMETYYQELATMRNFLASEIADEQMANSQMGFFMARFEELAREFKFMVDSFLAGEGSLWSHKLGMFVVTDEVKMIVKQMKPVLKKSKTSDINVRISSGLTSYTAENPRTDINAEFSSIDKPAHNELVGVKGPALEIMKLLTRGETKLKIISIVGMPGLGKTTTANFVYEHPSISRHFHVRAWCCVSQVYNKETLLADILSQIARETNSSHEEASAHDLALMVRRNLKCRRYLIVLDDIWDIAAWCDLESTFPNDNQGSRILFTTRHHDVARKAKSKCYSLPLLSVKKSNKLLWSKVFHTETCPPELFMICKRISRSCKGLPLVVVLVAGILRGTERRKKCWDEVAARVISLLGAQRNHSGEMSLTDILELSYNHLPAGLRRCFLYFASLPEDVSISVSKLIQFWISEGFVPKKGLRHNSVSEEAESYLDELIERSLVMIAKRSSNGGVKACRVHDVLRDFCLSKIRDEACMREESSFGGILRFYRSSIMFYDRPNGGIIDSNVRRRKALSQKKVSNKSEVRRRTAVSQAKPQTRNDYGLIFQEKFLRVLDLGNVGMESSADAGDIIKIATLVHLRFLGIRPRTTEIPAEIGNLLKLETLVLTGVIDLIRLPDSLWNLTSLRNVLMDNGYFSFQNCIKSLLENFSGLCNLESLSTLSLRLGDDVGNYILRRLPCLQKLACRFGYSWNDATGCCVFPALDFLNELRSLKLFFYRMMPSPCKFSFPSNLKKLSLSNSRLPWGELSVILRQQPNLEVLKLVSRAVEGGEWDMKEDDEFPKLKFLKLDSLNIQVWKADDKPFPNLEQLVVLRCPELEEIPSFFGEVSTLQSIEVKWCSSSAMDSVNQILEAQRDFSNDLLKVTLIGST